MVKNLTYRVDEPTDAGGGTWRCYYHILGEDGRPLHGKDISVEGFGGAEAARSAAEKQAIAEIARMKGEDRPREAGDAVVQGR